MHRFAVKDRTALPGSVGTPLRVGQRVIQAKLLVGSAQGSLEREADGAADRVMRMPDGGIQRAPCACGATCAACRGESPTVRGLSIGGAGAHTHEGSEAPPVVGAALQSSSQPIAASARAFFEPRFGHDFSKIRVHSNERSAAAAQAIGARAFTLGSDVVFGEGQYAPDSATGRQLLAHELAHAVQQGAVGPSIGPGAGAVQRAPAPARRKTLWINVGFDSSAQANEITMKKLRASVASEKAALSSCCSARSIGCNVDLKVKYDWNRVNKPAPADSDYDLDNSADNALFQKSLNRIKGPAGGVKVLATESTLSQTWMGARIFPRATTGATGVLWNRSLAADDTLAHESGHNVGYVGDSEGNAHSSHPDNLMSPGSIRQAGALPDANWCTQMASRAR